MKFFINEKNIKKNGRVTIYLVAHVNYKTVQINTKVDTIPEKFDVKNGRIIGRSKEVKDANLILDNCKKLVTEIFVKYRLENKPLTAETLLDEYKNPSRYIDFYKFLKDEILDRYKHNQISWNTRKQHLSLLNKLQEFKPVLGFSEITPKLIDRFEKHCKKMLNNKVNTIQGDLKRWRSYLNIAIRKGIIKTNPFDTVTIEKGETNRVYLTEAELNILRTAYIEGYNLKAYELRTLRHFMFMCFTGLRISDFRRVTHENIREGMLQFVTFKTSRKKDKEVSIYLTKQSLSLINDEGTTTGLLFNSISEQKMRIQIKEIVNKCGINKNVSLHTARHTFATLFLEKTNDVASLKELLGHARLEETMVYVHLSKKKINKQMQAFEASLLF